MAGLAAAIRGSHDTDGQRQKTTMEATQRTPQVATCPPAEPAVGIHEQLSLF